MSDNNDFEVIDEMLDHAEHLKKVKDMIKDDDLIGAYNVLEEMSNKEKCGVCSDIISNLANQVNNIIGVCQNPESHECASGISDIQDSVDDTKGLFEEAAKLVLNNDKD